MKVKPLLHCHLLVTGLFPEVAVPRLPGLEMLLAHARNAGRHEGDATQWLCRLFGVERQHDWPLAPFSALGDGLMPGGDYWLRADPVHLHLLRDRMVLADDAPLELAREEVPPLLAAVNRHFAADGLEFFAPQPGRWYLRMKSPCAIQTYALADAFGRDVDRMLPQGADAMLWHRRMNEIQMLLHGHPVNLAREERGEPAVNSLWFWGGGVLPVVESPLVGVYAEDVLARGLQCANQGEASPLPPSAAEWLETLPGEGEHLIVLNMTENIEHMEQRWFAPLLHELKRGRVAGIHLHLAQRGQVDSFVVERISKWKFWRRSKTLGDVLGG